MRKLSTFLLLPLALLGAIQSNMYYRGSMNSWGTTAMTFRNLGTDSWLLTIQSDGTDGSSAFKFDNETNWVGDDWSRGATVTLGSYTTWYSPNGGNSTFSESNTKYYTFIIKDVASSTNSQGFIMETSGPPVSITGVSDNSGSGANTSITVSITLNSSKSTEENVYVRYSNDAWATDNWVLASGSGTSYSATISTSGSGTVSYYVMTTTLTSTGSGDLDNYPDLSTLYYDNNGGSNYTYTYDQSLPVELAAFQGSATRLGVELTWSTASEIENQGFILQRKGGNQEGFSPLASFTENVALQGQGSSTRDNRYSYVDKNVTSGIRYTYLLSDVDFQNRRTDHWDKQVTVFYAPGFSEILPSDFKVEAIYPNPFNPVVTLRYDLLHAADLRLQVFDLEGNLRYSSLQRGQAAGQGQEVRWPGIDMQGQQLPAGVYLFKLTAGNLEIIRKATLLR